MIMNNEKTRPPNYCTIDDDYTRNHLRILINWLVNEVGSAGGDGDAIWYSQYYWINDIYDIVKEYNRGTKGYWKISFDEENGRISYGAGQEGLLITNNKEDFDNRPIWQQCLVVL